MSKSKTAVSISPPAIETIEVTVRGISPLITHAWNEKTKKQMLDKQMKKAAKAKEAKDPEADYQASIHRDTDGDPAFPSVGFKACAIRAGKLLGIPMTDLRQFFFIRGEMIKINGEHRMREDTVRLQGNTADLRYRAEFPEWEATLVIDYNSSLTSAEQIVNLINAGGFSVGVGEWRPERNGQYGRFLVA